MATTRIVPTRSVPVGNSDLDRVQKSFTDTVNAIVSKPLVDSQVVTVQSVATTADQIIVVSHNLSRRPVGMLLASASQLLTQVGKHTFTATTASVTLTQTTADQGSYTFVVF